MLCLLIWHLGRRFLPHWVLTQEFLEENLEDFWPADMWPPNSPHLLTCIGTIPYSNVSEMKKAVDKAWSELDQDYVKKSCESFP